MKSERAKYLLVLIFISSCFCSIAQQKVDAGKMNYIYNTKPNSILYNDTLYKGSRQFRNLFYRTGDPVLIGLYKSHQSNKIWANIIGCTGIVAMAVGVSNTSNRTIRNKTAGWILTCSGLAATVVGGRLLLCAQDDLRAAVTFFNYKHSKASAGIGFSGNRVGFVFKF